MHTLLKVVPQKLYLIELNLNKPILFVVLYQFHTPAREYLQSHTPVPSAQGVAPKYDSWNREGGGFRPAD